MTVSKEVKESDEVLLGLFASRAWPTGDVRVSIELQGDAWYGLLEAGGERHPIWIRGRDDDAYAAIISHYVTLISTRLGLRGYQRAIERLQGG